MAPGMQRRSSWKPGNRVYMEIAGGNYATAGVTYTLPVKRVLTVESIISTNNNHLLLVVRTIAPNQVLVVALDVSAWPNAGTTDELANGTALGTLGVIATLPSE